MYLMMNYLNSLSYCLSWNLKMSLNLMTGFRSSSCCQIPLAFDQDESGRCLSCLGFLSSQLTFYDFLQSAIKNRQALQYSWKSLKHLISLLLTLLMNWISCFFRQEFSSFVLQKSLSFLID